MKRLWLLGLLLWVAVAQAGGFWSSLWQTPDQRGEALLRQGHADQAARTYADPRRRAYAELMAGHYRTAARDFGALSDIDSRYNRGNALARAGDLQGAIKAYDAVLARDPKNWDARHNRDLVEQALHRKKPKQPKRTSGSKRSSRSGAGGKKQGAGPSGQSGGKTGRKQGGGKPGQQGKNAGSGAKPSRGGHAKQRGGAQQAAGAKPGQGSQLDQGSQVGRGAKANQGTQPNQGRGLGLAQTPDDAAQARRGAAAGLGRSQRKGNPGVPGGAEDEVRPGTARGDNLPPPSKRQLALDQWLRLIPDDPGGLLRRKFMIEYLMRKQEAQP